MTREEYAKLTPEEKRIKVAELCGFTKINPKDYIWHGNEWDGWAENFISGISKGNRVILPDYLNDLNAMHEAEKLLSRSQQHNYMSLLSWTDAGYKEPEDFILATAAQRAEAFVLTMTQE